MSNFKVGLVFNMANNQYLIAKALRKIGVDAELIINAKDFGMGLPHWEEADLDGIDPYVANATALDHLYKLPKWIRTWNPGSLHVNPLRIIDLMQMSREYDLLQMSPPCVVYLQFVGRPFIVHESGWIRHFPYLNSATEKLARRGYAYAECVVMTNPDCYSILPQVKHRKSIFIPFIVELDRYKPMPKTKTSDSLQFFNPSRQQWEVKGTDRLLHAFAQFIKKGYDAELTMVDWGTEEGVHASKTLVSELKIRKQVKWIAPVSKPRLIKLYNDSDVVFDQYLLGSYGTTTPEALACGKPVVMYLNPYWNTKCYGEVAPVVNARTVDEIFDAMCLLADPSVRQHYGQLGREYVAVHHSPENIAKQYQRLYEEVLA